MSVKPLDILEACGVIVVAIGASLLELGLGPLIVGGYMVYYANVTSTE